MHDIERLDAKVTQEIARSEQTLSELEQLLESLPDIEARLSVELREGLDRLESLCPGEPSLSAVPTSLFGIRI